MRHRRKVGVVAMSVNLMRLLLLACALAGCAGHIANQAKQKFSPFVGCKPEDIAITNTDGRWGGETYVTLVCNKRTYVCVEARGLPGGCTEQH
jgi:hypothetical protein